MRHSSKDGSIGALWDASPGVFTAVASMLDLLKLCPRKKAT